MKRSEKADDSPEGSVERYGAGVTRSPRELELIPSDEQTIVSRGTFDIRMVNSTYFAIE